MQEAVDDDALRAPKWQRCLWIAGGALSLLAGLIGLALPVLPTVPFVLLAAFCFSKGSRRCERWIVEHKHFGPHVRAWRQERAVPLRAKQFATLMMAGGCAVAWAVLPPPWGYVPPGLCLVGAAWLWWLPTARPRGAGAQGAGGLPAGGAEPPTSSSSSNSRKA